MKMSQFWPKSKAIALVFCSKLTKFEANLKLIDFDCRLKRAMPWYFAQMTKFEANLKLIDFGQKVQLAIALSHFGQKVRL